MIIEKFSSKAGPSPKEPVLLPPGLQSAVTRPQDYIAGKDLVDAVNTALLLHQPLLLTGEPGTGKTQLAYALAHQLGYQHWRFQAKSTSQSRDLFYTYDAVGHFRAPTGSRQLDFVRFEALGKAILAASAWEAVSELDPKQLAQRKPTPSVVLIDEIDKAPRDFPNDILAEIEDLTFKAPEIGIDLPAPQLRPAVVITSNSERDLPDAFLRRCVYYDIPFPERKDLLDILAARLRPAEGKSEDTEFCSTALDFFSALRVLPGLRKKPATAELIAWMTALRRAYPEASNPLKEPNAKLSRLGVLLKSREDLDLAARAFADKPGKG